MKFKCNLKFKGLEKKEAGTFIDKETGEVVPYPEKFVLYVDDICDMGIKQREIKVSVDNTSFINSCKDLKPYDDVCIEFLLDFYGNGGTKLTPIVATPIK